MGMRITEIIMSVLIGFLSGCQTVKHPMRIVSSDITIAAQQRPVDSFHALFSDKVSKARLTISYSASYGDFDNLYIMEHELGIDIGKETTAYKISFETRKYPSIEGQLKSYSSRFNVTHPETSAPCLCFLSGNVKCSASHIIPPEDYADAVVMVPESTTVHSVSYTTRTETSDARILLERYLLPPENTLNPLEVYGGGVKLKWSYYEGENLHLAENVEPMHIYIFDIFKLAQLIGFGPNRRHGIEFIDGKLTLRPVCAEKEAKGL